MKAVRAVFFVLLVCLAPASTAYASSIVVPGSSTSTEGDSNNAFPFNIDTGSQRYQQVYAASQFPGPILIDALVFRPDIEFGDVFASTLPNIQINLSTTSRVPGALSLTFANNVGANDTVVHTGALSLSSGFSGPANGPKDFDVIVPLSAPFFYDPALGNLLLDVRNFGGGLSVTLDSLGSSSLMSRVWSNSLNGVNNPTGVSFGDAGLVTEFQFHVTAVPEPLTLLLLGSGLTGVVMRLRSRA